MTNSGTGTSRLDPRQVDILASNAESDLDAYATALREWNAPDDEHTKYQLRLMLDRVVKRVFQPSGFYAVFVKHYNSRGRGTAPRRYASNMTFREASETVEKLRGDAAVYEVYCEPMEEGKRNERD